MEQDASDPLSRWRRTRHNAMTLRDCSRIMCIRSVAGVGAGVTAGDWQGQELQREVEPGI